MKTTKQHKEFWQKRKIDWKTQYLDTYNHPHRQLIINALSSFDWFSLWEVGCGPGANLIRVFKSFPGRQVGGSDVSQEAIELARSVFQGGKFHVESVEDMLLSDDATDVILSDACLIYVSPLKIDKALSEIKRIARNHVVLCEFHSNSLLKRWWFRLKTGYNAYNYQELLEKHGFYDIQMTKVTAEFWDGEPWTKWGYVITAKL